jgi:hypothetical protein
MLLQIETPERLTLAFGEDCCNKRRNFTQSIGNSGVTRKTLHVYRLMPENLNAKYVIECVSGDVVLM